MWQKNDELERYEKEEGVRELIALLKAAQPPGELQAPADFERRVLERVDKMPAQMGRLTRWRYRWATVKESWFAGFFDALHTLLWHPAFAYTLVVLLSIPWLLERGPVPMYFSPASPSSPHTSTDLHSRARAFLLHDYKAAYEARDIRLLAHIWPMSDQWRGNLEQLFTESQRILLLLDIDEPASTVREDGHSISVPVVQAVTITDRHGRLSLKGPFFCIADLRLDNNGQWSIVDFREDPYQPGSCRPPA